MHLAIGAHVAHFLVAGRSLAPLELNEALHTLHAGVVTAGVLLLGLAALSVLVVGRFFCGWACHLLALQDGCAWLLRKLRFVPRPSHARALALVPPAAMLYLFVWPEVDRALDGRPRPPLRILGPDDGFASFVSDDFFRNLPGPGIALATFAVCGAAMVVLLGTRSFCRHACPWGALFSAADRLAPGRIVATGDCSGCGACTAVCDSHVKVHEEVARHLRVVSPACLKDLDCVAACPTGALRFGFGKPALLTRASRREPLPWGEELALGALVLAGVLALRGLYGKVPFLLALGAAIAAAWLVVVAARLARGAAPRLGKLSAGRGGRAALAALGVLAALFLAQSGWVRFHERRGLERLEAAARGSRDAAALEAALADLDQAARWGLVRPGLGELPRRSWQRSEAHRALGDLRAASGDRAAARGSYEAAVEADPSSSVARIALGTALAREGRLAEAEDALEAALERNPDSVAAARALEAVRAARQRKEGAR